jgi:ankyrin repeat protein
VQKRLFIKQVRDWNATTVGNALKEEPELARYVDDIGKTPLHHCAGMNALETTHDVASSVATAEALISSGADVNAVRIIIDDGDEFRATPLWYAIAWGKNPALTRFLLKQGARPDDNAVRSAIWDQDLEIANLLLSFGGNIDAEIHHQTPLLETVKAKRMKPLDWLVGNGARINFQDGQGYSALHYAVKRNHNLKQVAELLQLGADPDLKGKDGATPLSLARKLGKTKLTKLLEETRE